MLSINDLNKLIKLKPNNFIIICFDAGMGGSALLRILISHKEIYNNPKYLSQNEYDDPIRYPDSIEGFNMQWDHRLSFKEQHLACAHIDFYTPWGNKYEKLEEYFKIVSENRIAVLKTHDFSIINRFPSTQIILIEGEMLERGTILNSLTDLSEYKENNVFRININNLFSYDYDTFLNEYLRLVRKFNLTPRINSVRSFILLWLEKQKRFNLTLS